MKNIQYYTKHVYGIAKDYALDKTINEAVQLLNGHTTMTDQDKKALELLGYSFTKVLQPEYE